MAGKDQELIKSINEELNANALIDAIGFGNREAVSIGGAIRTPCMIHGDENTATLLVFINKHTCKCLKPGCRANREMSLVEMYSLFSGKPMTAAAIEAAQLAGMDLDSEISDSFTETHLHSATTAIEENRLDDAWHALEKARDIEPDSVDISLAAGRLAEIQDRLYLATGEYTAAARFAVQHGKIRQAAGIFTDHVLRLEPDHDDNWLEYAELLIRLERKQEYVKAVLTVCEIREKAGRAGENVELYEQLGPELETKPKLRTSFARALEAAGQPERAMEEYLLAAATLPHNESEQRIAAFEAIHRLDPQNIEAREGLANLYQKADRQQEAYFVCISLAEDALEKEDLERARFYFDKALQNNCGNIDVFEGLAFVLEQLDRPADELPIRLRAAQHYIDKNDEEDACRHLERAEAINPDHAGFKRVHAEYLLNGDKEQEAVDILEQAAQNSDESNDPEEIERAMRRLCQLRPAEVAYVVQLGEFLQKQEKSQEAISVLDEALRDKKQSEENHEAIAHAILRINPGHVAARIQLAKGMRQKDEVEKAAEQYLAAAQSREEEGHLDDAEKLLRQAAAIAPRETKCAEELAAFFQRHEKKDDAGVQLRHVAELYVSRGELDHAIEQLEHCLELIPNDYVAQHRLAQIFLEQGKKEEAATMFEMAARGAYYKADVALAVSWIRRSCEIDPDNVAISRTLIRWLVEDEQLEDAQLQAYTLLDFLLRNANIGEAHEFLSQWQEETDHEWELSAPLLEKAALLQQNTFLVRYIEEYADKARGDRELATALSRFVFAQQLEDRQLVEPVYGLCNHHHLDEDSLQLGLLLGRIYLHNHLHEEAEALFRKLVLRHLNRPEPRLGLADYLHSVGNVEEAAEAFVHLAEEAVDEGETNNAERYLRRACDILPNHPGANLHLGRLLMRSGLVEESIPYFKTASTSLVEAGKRYEALLAFEEIISQAPKDIQLQLAYFEHLQSFDASDKQFSQALRIAEVHMSVDELRRGLEWLKKAAEIRSTEVTAQLEVANFLVEHDQHQIASAHLGEYGQRYIEADNPKNALKLAVRAYEINNTSAVNLRFLTRVYKANDDFPQAAKTLEELGLLHERKNELGEAEAVWRELLDLDENNFTALSRLRDIYQSTPPSDVNAHAGVLIRLEKYYEEVENDKEMAKCLRQLLKLKPDDLQAHLRLADYLHQIGDQTKAFDEYFHVAKKYADKEEYKKCLSAATLGLGIQPRHIGLLTLQVNCAREAQDWNALRDAAVSTAELLKAKDDIDQAIEMLESIAGSEADGLRPRELWGEMLVSSNNKEQAATVYIEGAQILSDSGKIEAACELLKAADDLHLTDKEILIRIGEAYFSADSADKAVAFLHSSAAKLQENARVESALALYEIVLQHINDDYETLNYKARLLETEGRNSEAAGVYAKIIELEVPTEAKDRAYVSLLHNDPARVEEAEQYIKWLISEGKNEDAALQKVLLAMQFASTDFDRALAFAGEAREVLGDHPRLRLFDATMAEKNGELEIAAKHYKWLGEFSVRNQALEDAVYYFEKSIALGEPNPDEMIALADIHENLGNMEKASEHLYYAALESENEHVAVEILKRSRDLNPQNEEALLKLATLLEQQKRFPEAEVCFLSAIRLRLESGAVEQAREMASKLLETETGRSDLLERIANVYEEAGIPELAAREFLALANQYVESDSPADAVQWCDRVLALKPRSIEARELLVETYKKLDSTDECHRMLYELATIWEEAFVPDKAAKALEEIIEKKPEASFAIAKLADIYDGLGDIEESRELLLKLVDIHKRNNHLESAFEVLLQLASRFPNDLSIVQMLVTEGQQQLAASELLPHCLNLANLYIENGDSEKASATYQKINSIEPTNAESRAAYVEFLLNSGDDEKAVLETDELIDIYLSLDRIKEAAEMLKLLQTAGQEKPTYYVCRAKVYQAQNQRGMALQELQKAAELFGTNGKFGDKAHALDMALLIDPGNIDFRRENIKTLRIVGQMDRVVDQQMKLAETYADRGLFDLAEAEYKAIVTQFPHFETAWHRVFESHRHHGSEKELIPDYLGFATTLAAKEDYERALDYVSKAMSADPTNIPAREKYIELYRHAGGEKDLLEDFLDLADLYVAAGEVDRGVEMYSKVMSLDPEHEEARDRLAETRTGRRAAGAPLDRVFNVGQRPHKTAKAADQNEDGSKNLSWHEPEADKAATQEVFFSERGALDFLADELDEIDEGDEQESLEQLLSSYKDILAVNPQNASVRTRLADVYLQLDQQEKHLDELSKASEIFARKGELNNCIQTCERILKLRPADQLVRQRLKQALNKRDAFKALQSDIFFHDAVQQETE